ncbi:nucleoside phosphorylase domain-containing protein [Aspergillus carlsbadensis]|nr:nucleoside phosphorylase domain-containing protein [Aspergillus carlsbadensis]
MSSREYPRSRRRRRTVNGANSVNASAEVSNNYHNHEQYLNLGWATSASMDAGGGNESHPALDTDDGAPISTEEPVAGDGSVERYAAQGHYQYQYCEHYGHEETPSPYRSNLHCSPFESSEGPVIRVTPTVAPSPENSIYPAPQDVAFDVAVFCALPLEADAIETLFDYRWDTEGGTVRYNKAYGDPNSYSMGSMGTHNVVLVHMPGMGKSHGAAVAAFCRASFPTIKLALVVGICGGAPTAPDGKVIRLGDVVISSALVQYDFGRMRGDGFVRKDTLLDNLGRPSMEIRSALARLDGRWGRKRLGDEIRRHVGVLVQELGRGYVYPPGHDIGEPAIHIGLVASGDQVMRSEEIRDGLIRKEGVIAFEMEGAGVWDTFPCLVIKGVADYADCHKNKDWQNYAAATAAACAKGFLELWS